MANANSDDPGRFKVPGQYFYIIAFILVIVLVFLVIKPYIASILAGAVMAYIFYPLYKFVVRLLKQRHIVAILVSLFLILLFTVPVFFLLNSTAQEANYLYVRTKQILATGDLLGVGCTAENPSVVCRTTTQFTAILANEQVRYHIAQGVEKSTDYILQSTSKFIFSLPSVMLSLFVAFFTLFYLFIDGEDLVRKIREILPLKKEHQKHLFKKLDDVVYAVIYGSIIIALVQGLIAAVGYWIFGIPSPVLWGLATALFALIPFVGTALIWVPASILQIVTGYATGDAIVFWQGIGLLIYGAVLISTIDNILKPRIIGGRSQIHPVLILIGVLGGLKFLGFMGFIIGPLIFALFFTFLEIYEKEKQHM